MTITTPQIPLITLYVIRTRAGKYKSSGKYSRWTLNIVKAKFYTSLARAKTAARNAGEYELIGSSRVRTHADVISLSCGVTSVENHTEAYEAVLKAKSEALKASDSSRVNSRAVDSFIRSQIEAKLLRDSK
jgi:hypothetical protein